MKFLKGDTAIVVSGFAPTFEEAMILASESEDEVFPHKVPVGSIVEILIVDESDENQPYAVAIETDIGYEIQWLMESQLMELNFDSKGEN